MNILIAVSDLSIGGAQRAAINLANGIARLHPEHHVVLYDVEAYPPDEGMAASISSEFAVFRPSLFRRLLDRLLASVLYRTALNRRFAVRTSIRQRQRHFRRVLRKHRIDVINSHTWWADKFVREALGSMAIPHAVSMHGSYEEVLSNGYLKTSEESYMRKVLAKCSAVIYASDKNLQVFDKLLIEKPGVCKKLYYVVELRKPDIPMVRNDLQIERDAFTMCIASRAIESKGWDIAVETALTLRERGHKVELLLLGVGPSMVELQQRHADKKFLHFMGPVEHVEPYLAVCDCAIFPTTYRGESLPNFVLESLFSSVPVVTTDIAEIPAMLTVNGKTAGVIIPTDQSKESIAEQFIAEVQQLIMNPDRLARMKELARECAARYSPEEAVDDNLRVFEKVTGA